MNFGEWSAVRISVVALAWPLLVVGYLAIRIIRLSSRGGAFVSAGIAKALLVLIGPPLLLVIAWLFLQAGSELIVEPPNPRMQRTRSPWTRHPLGRTT